MFMNVNDLNNDQQFQKLKEMYFDQIQGENEEGEVAENITCADDIPDDVILHHYKDVDCSMFFE